MYTRDKSIFLCIPVPSQLLPRQQSHYLLRFSILPSSNNTLQRHWVIQAPIIKAASLPTVRASFWRSANKFRVSLRKYDSRSAWNLGFLDQQQHTWTKPRIPQYTPDQQNPTQGLGKLQPHEAMDVFLSTTGRIQKLSLHKQKSN